MKKVLPLLALTAALAAAGCTTTHHGPPTQGPGSTEPPPVAIRTTPPTTRPPVAHSLVSTRWRLEQVDGADVVSGSRASLVISPEGRMGGNTSCNTMFGHVTIEEHKITFGQMGSTKMACSADGVMQQEQRYLNKLKQVVSWRIEGATLYLTNRARRDVLVFEAQ